MPVPRHVSDVPCAGRLELLGGAALFLLPGFLRASPRELCDRIALTVTGYLRRPPDRTAESQLRAVFAEFDRELAVILAGRAPVAVPDH
jgi:hypothetical protein